MLPFRENVEEMLQKNPISVFTNERKTPGIMAEKHWHPCIELQYILEGTAYQNVNETELVLKKGEAILIPSGSVHMTKSLYSECSILVVLFFPEEVFPAISLDVSNTSIIHPLFSLLYEEQKSKNPGFTYISQGLLLQILGMFLRNGQKLPITLPENEGQKLEEYLRTHTISGISLIETAKYAGYSPSYFSKHFKEIMGKSFKDYCEQLKLQAAKQMLIDGYAVSQISETLHYANASSFSRAFKQWTGYTPSQFQIEEGMDSLT